MSVATSRSKPEATTISAVLHLVVFGGLIFYAWWSQRVDTDDAPIFELVAGPGNDWAAEQAPTTTEVTEPTVTLELPKPRPRPVAPPPPKPLPRETPPPPVQKAPPAPVQPAPKPVKPAEPKREKVSFDQFAQQHGAPKTQKVAAPKPIKAKTIDVGQIMSATKIITTGAGGTAMTAQEVSLSKRYVAFIIQQIRDSVERAGITDLREVGVRFSVSASGAVSGASVTRSSGSSSFDQAVLKAFRDLPNMGAPPTKRAEVFTTVIRLTER